MKRSTARCPQRAVNHLNPANSDDSDDEMANAFLRHPPNQKELHHAFKKCRPSFN
jgi:hypothetical protein